MNYLAIALLTLAALTSAGCELVGNIFQAGVWVGVFGVLLIVFGVSFLAFKIRG